MTEQERLLIQEWRLKRISEEDFVRALPPGVPRACSYAAQVVNQASSSRSSLDLEDALFLAERFGCIDSTWVNIFCDLIVQDWHKSHEFLASELQRLRDPRSVEALYETALRRPSYLAHDDSHALAVKCLWALHDIDTQEANHKLEMLSRSGVEVISRNARTLLAERQSIKDRRVRAYYTEDFVRVYQAYSDEIADIALRDQRFGPPFRGDRFTWIKPSFLWMMYRSAWATRSNQTRVLAIDITRTGFEWALLHSCPSQYDPRRFSSRDEWVVCKNVEPVRVQWDPDRSITLDRLDAPTIQIGLGPELSGTYMNEWIRRISDQTTMARRLQNLVESGRISEAMSILPEELEYPLPDEVAKAIGVPARAF